MWFKSARSVVSQQFGHFLEARLAELHAHCLELGLLDFLYKLDQVCCHDLHFAFSVGGVLRQHLIPKRRALAFEHTQRSVYAHSSHFGRLLFHKRAIKEGRVCQILRKKQLLLVHLGESSKSLEEADTGGESDLELQGYQHAELHVDDVFARHDLVCYLENLPQFRRIDLLVLTSNVQGRDAETLHLALLQIGFDG